MSSNTAAPPPDEVTLWFPNGSRYPYYFRILGGEVNFHYQPSFGLKLYTEIISVLTTLLFGFAVWMILSYTPKEIKTHRWFLMLYLLASYAYDIQMFALSRPVVYTPLILVRTFGPLSMVLNVPIQLQLCFLVATMCIMATSITLIFYYRLHVFLSDTSWLKVSQQRLVFVIILGNALPASIMAALFYVVLPSNEQTLQFLEEVIPASTRLITEKPGIIVVDEYTAPLFAIVGYIFVCVILVSAGLAIACAAWTVGILNIRFRKHKLTEATHRRQVTVQRNLIILSVVPAASLLPPLLFFFYCTIMRPPWVTPKLNACVSISCLHAPCVSILILLLNTAYRRATKRVMLDAMVRTMKAVYKVHSLRPNHASPQSTPSFSS